MLCVYCLLFIAVIDPSVCDYDSNQCPELRIPIKASFHGKTKDDTLQNFEYTTS